MASAAQPVKPGLFMPPLRYFAGSRLRFTAGSAPASAPPSLAQSAPVQPSASAPATAKPGATVSLKVWDGQTTIEAPIYIALERGYFKDQGIDLQPVDVPGAFDAQVPLLATGQLDVGGGSIVPALFNAAGRGLPIRMSAIGTMHVPGRSQLFVARKDLVDSGQLDSYTGLKGKVIARPTPLGSVTIAIEKALEKGGLTASDITWVELPIPDTIPALANKKVDIGFLAEPFAAQAIARGVAVKWREMADTIPNHVSSIWVYGSKLIQDDPETGKRFMVAVMRGMRDYEDAFGKNKGRADVVNILVKHTAVKDPALYDKMQAIFEPAAGQFPLDTLQQDFDWLKAHGGIQQPAPELTKVVDTRFVQYAVQTLGPYQ
jgi:ABC-type nitrate/sulfonate/bicarbonate transport system substrate-binding protein